MDSSITLTTVAFYAAVFVVGSLSTARIVRLIGFDHYPPAEWLRAKWDQWTRNSEWNLLVRCPYCLAPYVGLGVLLWGYFTDFNTVWWLANGWLAAVYVAAVFVSYDGDD